MDVPLIVVGGGGHARVLIYALQLLHRRVLGYVDAVAASQPLTGVPYLGNDRYLRQNDPTGLELVNGVGSIGLGSIRHRLYLDFRRMGFRFASVIHPAAEVAADVRFGEGVQVMAGAIVQPGCRVGANSIINTGAIVDHDCRIGVGVHIAPGAVLSGQVSVAAETHIGTGAVIIQSIKIGARSTIGAGAVVVRNVQSGVTAVGVPAKAMAT